MNRPRPSLTAVGLATAVAVLSAVALGCSGLMVYGDGARDDLLITALLKGLFGLPPGSDGIFLAPVLGAGLAALYQVSPATPWFSLLLHTGMALACWTSCLTMLTAVRGRVPRVLGLLGVGFFVGIVWVKLGFSSVALMLWGSACGFVAAIPGVSRPPRWLLAVICLQLVLAYLLRPDFAPLLLWFAAPLLLLMRPAEKRRAALTIFAPVLVVAVCGWLYAASRGEDDYTGFNRARAMFNDTSRGAVTASTEAALAATGWSREDYLVARNWWLHDGTLFSRARFETFLAANAGVAELFSPALWYEHLRQYAGYLVLCAGGVALLAGRGGARVSLWAYLLYLGGLLALMGMRFPQRVALPAFFLAFVYGLVLFSAREGREQERGYAPLGYCGLILLAAALGLLAPETLKAHSYSVHSRQMQTFLDETRRAVLEKNGDDTCFVDVNPHKFPNSFRPFAENEPGLRLPILSGGWHVGTAAYAEQFRRAGLGDRTTAVAAMIDNRRIVLSFWDSPALTYADYVGGIFLPHLQRHYLSASSGEKIRAEIVRDFRQGGYGMVYFRLVKLR